MNALGARYGMLLFLCCKFKLTKIALPISADI